MRKILRVGLMLIASGSAYSDGKEYTLKTCMNDMITPDCSKCGEVKGKISFKVSKSLNSVMKDIVRYDGSQTSTVVDNCKIFDDETFECKKTNNNSEIIDILSNGKWSWSMYINDNLFAMTCGEEIR